MNSSRTEFMKTRKNSPGHHCLRGRHDGWGLSGAESERVGAETLKTPFLVFPCVLQSFPVAKVPFGNLK